MESGQKLLEKWDERIKDRFHPLMEVTGGGLRLGAGTLLAKMQEEELALDSLRAMALLAAAYERPATAVNAFEKLRRACELWNEGERALAQIYLVQANLPRCDEKGALRLFVVQELLEAGVMPTELVEAQGLNSALLRIFNADQPRVPAGNGRESGRWTDGSGGGVVIPASHRTRAGIRAIRDFLDWLRGRSKAAEHRDS